MALATCTITGTLYKPDGITLAVGEALRIVKCVLSGGLITSYLHTTPVSDSNGVIAFTAPQGATIWVWGDVVGLNGNASEGTALVVPSNSTATLSALVPPTSTPGLVPVATPGGGYQFTQATPALTWTITHGLNSRPLSVQLFDLNWKKIEGTVDESTSANVIVVTFNVAQAGYARIA